VLAPVGKNSKELDNNNFWTKKNASSLHFFLFFAEKSKKKVIYFLLKLRTMKTRAGQAPSFDCQHKTKKKIKTRWGNSHFEEMPVAKLLWDWIVGRVTP
jgi:hypothetical protein